MSNTLLKINILFLSIIRKTRYGKRQLYIRPIKFSPSLILDLHITIPAFKEILPSVSIRDQEINEQRVFNHPFIHWRQSPASFSQARSVVKLPLFVKPITLRRRAEKKSSGCHIKTLLYVGFVMKQASFLGVTVFA